MCTGTACHVKGSNRIVQALSEEFEIADGETTADGKFTLSTVECLGSCGTAPVMQVNDDYYEDLSEDKVDAILDGLR